MLAAACNACSDAPATPAGPAGSGDGSATGGNAGHPAGGSGATAGEGTGGAVSGGGTTGGSGGGGSACSPQRPAQVPDGWVAFTQFSCDLPLWLPATTAALPEPIIWEPCGDELVPAVDCRRMAISWAHKGPTTSTVAALHVPDDGEAPLIFFMRSSGAHEAPLDTLLIAEADGDVLFAATSTYRLAQGLRIIATSGFDGRRFGISLRGHKTGSHADESPAQAVAIGTVGSLDLDLFRHEETESTLSWSVNSHYVQRISAQDQTSDLYPVTGGEPARSYSRLEDPDRLQLSQSTLVEKDVVWAVTSLRKTAILSYTPTEGTQSLVRWVGDLKQGAYAVGSDGTDLVWISGDDHEDGEGIYLTRTVVTAPYTTNADSLNPRTLRTDLKNDYSSRFVVGCGYAARDIGSKGGLEIIRLADGHAWYVGSGLTKNIGRVVGITCDEVFFALDGIDDSRNDSVFSETDAYARVRLDSLGDGVPADL
jgi:hypothetical protein